MVEEVPISNVLSCGFKNESAQQEVLVTRAGPIQIVDGIRLGLIYRSVQERNGQTGATVNEWRVENNVNSVLVA